MLTFERLPILMETRIEACLGAGGWARISLILLAFVIYASGAEINPPIGPYVNPGTNELAQATRFGTNDPVVLTSYFYWYDIYSNAHILNSDGSDALTDHPPTLTGFSFRSSSWHRRQLQDMKAAGIDVLLPVYWGEPSQRVPGKPVSEQPWSFSALPVLVEARDALLAAGEKPPAIGLFYDTSTLEFNTAGKRVDLTTEAGRRWFYETIRDYFSLIPARHWATIEGRPIVFLYAAAFAVAHDQTCIDYVRQEFARDFSGRDPYIVREISWNVQADNIYAWGGAISLRNPGVAALGPGYDHSAVPGREPLIVPREGGAFFERNWTRFLRAPSRLVHVETWNEYHEGTDIAESKEYGRLYIDLNRKFVDMFKAGIKPPRPRGPYSDFKSVSATLQATNDSRGLTQFESADGATVPAEAGGKTCRAVAPTVYAGQYVYFQIHDSYKWADRMLVDVEVEYFDQGTGSFRIEYDGSDSNAPYNGAYTASKTSATLSNSGQWKVAKFRLLESRFLNSQNDGADFRIAVQVPGLKIREVKMIRLGLPGEAGATLRGWQQDFAEPLGTNWMMVGNGDAFRQVGGTLRIGPTAEGPTLLLTTACKIDTAPIEVLSRVRPVSTESTPNYLGGLAVVTDPATGNGYGALLRRDLGGATLFGLISSSDNYGPFAAVAWHTNEWYWLRVRHQTNILSGSPDLWARLWPADGETPEPGAWTTWRDYFPANKAVGGFTGIVAGQGLFEIDWLLIKADGLSETVARPPARKPALATLTPLPFSRTEGLRLSLHGDPGVGYILEATSDFLTWNGSSLATDSTGQAIFQDPSLYQQRFYRARLIQ
jgi:hypothetical protein